jgi:mRNA interferase MazF
MTAYEKGDIILVPFPFSELTSMKKRPALVMASIEHRDELICMMLTSTSNIDISVDVPIKKMGGTGLPKPTVARTSRLFTLKSILVYKKLGKIEDSDFKEILLKLNKLLQ